MNATDGLALATIDTFKNQVICCDAMTLARSMPSQSIQTIITSPPYFGLRDYGTGTWEGGDPSCEHKERTNRNDGSRQGIDGFGGNGNRHGHADMGIRQFRDMCPKCGALRIDQQIGLEQSPEEYITRLVLLFRELRRALRDDGTLWLNLGDSYAGSSMTGGNNGFNKSGGETGYKQSRQFRKGGENRIIAGKPTSAVQAQNRNGLGAVAGAKSKDLLGIPWRVALALQADGWYLRSDIIWHKPSPMPESVTDRPTKAHEYVFLLAKGERYYYDADAVKEPAQDWPGKEKQNLKYSSGEGGITPHGGLHNRLYAEAGRNKRTVWTVASQPFPDAHFATFPPALIEPMVLAGSKPSDIVYDPFLGSGTTALVARKHKRDYIGSELNPEYADMARDRLRLPFEKRRRQPKSDPLDVLPLFATLPTA